MVFVYAWKLQWLPSSKGNAHVLNTQKEKNCETSLYIKPDTFQKARQFPFRFIFKKQYTLRYGIFHEIFWSWHLYSKSMTLCVTWRFYIQNGRHFAKSKTIWDTFLYTKIWHLALRDFSLNFWNLRRGWDIYVLKKQCTLRDILYWKNNALCFTLLYTKSLTLCVTFQYPKNSALFVTFIYI